MVIGRRRRNRLVVIYFIAGWVSNGKGVVVNPGAAVGDVGGVCRVRPGRFVAAKGFGVIEEGGISSFRLLYA